MNKLRDDYLNLTITSAAMSETELRLGFENGKSLVLTDDLRCCCEQRYMTSDDDVAALVGGKLVHIEVKDGPDHPTDEDDGYVVHDLRFVEVQASTGLVTIVNHNVHNGYYGGFSLDIDYHP